MKNIIIQGLPGIGKTTLVKKVANKLNEMAIEATGFYTEELRDNKNYRIGFDIVTLDNKRGILARKSCGGDSKFKVGSYNVQLDNFEKIALPVFENTSSVLIIDEIGKMELFSKKFQTAVEKVIALPNVQVIATVPLMGGPSLVQNLKKSSSSNLITVNASNRDKLIDEIIALITK